jgi:hypothetical protein
MNKFFWIFMIACAYFDQVSAQSYDVLSLSDMSSFVNPGANWQVVQDVNIPLHKLNSNDDVKTVVGNGTLLNLPTDKDKTNLITKFEHGDVELEFDFMMPAHSNSGVYLQGRYEIQLYDSWGVQHPKYSDLGGIYRNWEQGSEKFYAGKAPLANASRAPGLWQHISISFSAPKFDTAGVKIKNALFKMVKINGVTIHENIEVPQMTGGPIFDKEGAKGPIMIQGDHGAIAIKNFKYRLLESLPIIVSNTTYKYWKGNYRYDKEYKDKAPTKQGNSHEGLTWEMADVQDYFAVQLNADLNIPAEDDYFVSTIFNGNLTIYIDGKTVLPITGAWDWDRLPKQKIHLSKGAHKIEVHYSRHDAWLPPAIGIFLESNHMRPQAINASSAFKQREALYPIEVSTSSEPKMLRAFLDYKGDRSLRRTHTIGVADPSKIHYVYDLGLGTVSCIWKGDFVDATPMWHDRGDGSFRPLGDVVYLSNESQYIKNGMPLKYKVKGYKLDEASSMPIFQYNLDTIKVMDRIIPDALQNGVVRDIVFDGSVADIDFVYAAASVIEKQIDGTYKVDGAYYLNVPSMAEIKSEGKSQKLIGKAANNIHYTILW